MGLSRFRVLRLRRILSDSPPDRIGSPARCDAPPTRHRISTPIRRDHIQNRCQSRALARAIARQGSFGTQNRMARTLQCPFDDILGRPTGPVIHGPLNEGVMTAKELMDAGQLGPAVARLGEDLRARPADRTARTFLFELLCFSNDFDRAERQLDVLGNPDGDPLGVQVYRSLLAAERTRSRLFAEGLRPRFVLDPPPAVELHLEALDLVRQGHFAEARAALDRAARMQAPLGGTVGKAPFGEFRDVDDILA